MPRLASLERHSLPALGLLLVCGTLGACTQQRADDESSLPVRQVQDSGQNRALAFDGLDDYATTGTAQFPAALGPQTISAWFEAATNAGKHALITLRKDGDSGVELAIQDGLVGAWRTYGNRTLVIATTPITIGVWHHAAYTFDGTTHQLYVDGALVANTTNTSGDRTPTTCWLGTLDGTNDLFAGNIDDFRVFNVVRTSAQIAAEAAGAFSSNEPGLVLYLPCNEPGANLIYDHSPLANDGQLGDGIEPRLPGRIASGAPTDGT